MENDKNLKALRKTQKLGLGPSPLSSTTLRIWLDAISKRRAAIAVKLKTLEREDRAIIAKRSRSTRE